MSPSFETMIATAGVAASAALVIGCTTPSRSASPALPSSSSSSSQPSEVPTTAETSPASQATPRCLNVQDGDRHVEFDGKRLLVSEQGAPKALSLDDGARVVCDKLEVLSDARQGAVLIEFETDQKGTSIGISDKKMGIASIADGEWIVAPMVLERHFSQSDETSIEEKTSVVRSKESDGKAVFILTDSKSHESQTVKP